MKATPSTENGYIFDEHQPGRQKRRANGQFWLLLIPCLLFCAAFLLLIGYMIEDAARALP